MSPKDLEKYLKLCRKYGVTRLSVQDLSIELSDLPSSPNIPPIDTQKDPLPASKPISEEDMLFWSSGGIAS